MAGHRWTGRLTSIPRAAERVRSATWPTNDRGDDVTGRKPPDRSSSTAAAPRAERARQSRRPCAAHVMVHRLVWYGNPAATAIWREHAAPASPARPGPAQASYRPIVQNRRGRRQCRRPADFTVNTEKVPNSTPGAKHWLRFTSARRRLCSHPAPLADGRGPHPSIIQTAISLVRPMILKRRRRPGRDGTLGRRTAKT